MKDYKGNSITGTKKVEKVITGKVIHKKQPLGKRFMSTFFDSDNKGVIEYIVYDILTPSIKSIISEVVSKGIDAMLYGAGSRGRNFSRNKGVSTPTNYTKYSYTPMPQGRTVATRNAPRRQFEDIIVADRAEAEMVLSNLMDIIAAYNVTKVADLYEMVGLDTASPYTQRYGWTNLDNASIDRVREGYFLNLPKPEDLTA